MDRVVYGLMARQQGGLGKADMLLIFTVFTFIVWSLTQVCHNLFLISILSETTLMSTLFLSTLPPRARTEYNSNMRLTVEIVSVPQAADELGLHENTVRQLIRTGKLPAQQVGREWAILRPNLDWFKTLDRPPGRPPKDERDTRRPPE